MWEVLDLIVVKLALETCYPCLSLKRATVLRAARAEGCSGRAVVVRCMSVWLLLLKPSTSWEDSPTAVDGRRQYGIVPRRQPYTEFKFQFAIDRCPGTGLRLRQR